jgi:kynureninase
MNKWHEQAQQMDLADPLRSYRSEFWIPQNADGSEQAYFCGNSLGLQPRSAEGAIAEELDTWKRMGIEGYFTGEMPWITYLDLFRDQLATLVGALPCEVAVMNTLTANLHMMMVSFYQPSGERRKILIERQPFPSDHYAVQSQVKFHGLDPEKCVVELGAGADDRLIDEELIEDYLARHGHEIALVLWPGLHYATGQLFDLDRITAAAHNAGAMIGFDLAHSAGNVPLDLHKTGPDFAAWCNYKYLNSGAGAAAACFVHERHHGSNELPRFHGWWGNDLENRFKMEPVFKPASGIDAWQLSNPPTISQVLIRASMEIFARAGMPALRQKSLQLTAWLEQIIQQELDEVLQIITPADPGRRGCQLSLRVRGGRERGRKLFEFLLESGVIVDWREPDVIRAAPVPLYNSFEDCARLAGHIKSFVETS